MGQNRKIRGTRALISLSKWEQDGKPPRFVQKCMDLGPGCVWTERLNHKILRWARNNNRLEFSLFGSHCSPFFKMPMFSASGRGCLRMVMHWAETASGCKRQPIAPQLRLPSFLFSSVQNPIQGWGSYLGGGWSVCFFPRGWGQCPNLRKPSLLKVTRRWHT